MNNYPAFRFGPNGTSVVVISAEEDSMLPEGWSDQVHGDFDPKTAPTYPGAEFVPVDIDVDAIADDVLSHSNDVVKRKPGRPKKVE